MKGGKEGGGGREEGREGGGRREGRKGGGMRKQYNLNNYKQF